MATNLETLELKISANAQDASKGLGKLISSLSVLNQKIQAPLNSLKSLNAELRTLRDLTGKSFSAFTKGKEQAASVGKATTAIHQQSDAVNKVGDAWDRVAESAKKATKVAAPADWRKGFLKQQNAQMRDQEWLQKRNSDAEAAMRQRTELFLGMRMDSPNMRRYQYNMAKNEIADKGIENFSKQYYLSVEQVQQRMAQLEEIVNGTSQRIASDTAKTASEVKKSTDQATGSTKAFTQAKQEATRAVQQSAQASELEAAKLAKVNAQTEKIQAQTERIRQQTKQIQERVSDLGNEDKSVKKLSVSFSKMLSTVGRIGKMMLIRTAIRAVLKGAKEGLDNFYQYSKKLNNGYSQAIDAVSSRWKQMKNQIGATLGTALAAVLPILEAICTAAITALNTLSALFAALSGKSTYSQATLQAGEYETAAKGAAKATKELLANFDELNVLADKNGGSGAGAIQNFGEMFQEVQVPQWLVEWQPLIKAVLAGALGAYILPKIWDWLKKIFDLFGGQGALNFLDILKKMLKVGDKDMTPSTKGWDKFLKPFTDPDIGDGVGKLTDLFDTIKNLDWKKLLIQRLPELLKLALEVITKLVQGMDVESKVKVDRKEFDKLKKDYDKWIKGDKDKVVNVVLNPITLAAFYGAIEAITQPVDKNINIVVDPESINVMALINSLLTVDQEKNITIKPDEDSVRAFRIISDILTTTQDKTLSIKPDADSVRAFQIITDILTTTQNKTISIKPDADSVRAFNIISDILGTTQSKTISVKPDADSVRAFQLINDILTTTGEKKVNFKFDPESVNVATLINTILTTTQDKIINVKINNDDDMISKINEWVSQKDTKDIEVNFTVGNNQNRHWIDDDFDSFVRDLLGTDVDTLSQRINSWIYDNVDKVELNVEDFVNTELGKPGQKPWWDWDIADLTNAIFGTNIKTLPDYITDWASENVEKATLTLSDFVKVDNSSSFTGSLDTMLNQMVSKAKTKAQEFATQFSDQKPKMSVSADWAKTSKGTSYLEYLTNKVKTTIPTMTTKLNWSKTSKGTTYLAHRKAEVNDASVKMKSKLEWVKGKKKATVLGDRKGEVNAVTGEMHTKLSWYKNKKGSALDARKNEINNAVGTMLSKLNWKKENGDTALDSLLKDVNNASGTITAKTSLDQTSLNDVVNTINGKTATIKVDAVLNNAASFGQSVATAIANNLKIKLQVKQGGGYNNWTLEKMATGGLVDSGDIFIANENGKAEMIGRFGNQTAVANQEQMVEAMARGVAYANSEQNSLLREQNGLLRAILQKEASVKIGASSALGKTVKQSLAMYGAVTGG